MHTGGVAMFGSQRVLLVDDEIQLIDLHREWLQDAGYEVYFATNVNDANALLVTHMPDLAIVDLLMPGIKPSLPKRKPKDGRRIMSATYPE